jgi:hypothetical protein
MKQVGPANTALRGDIDKMDAAVTKERAALLKNMFTQTEAFWKAKGKPEPTQMSHDALKDTEALEAAVCRRELGSGTHRGGLSGAEMRRLPSHLSRSDGRRHVSHQGRLLNALRPPGRFSTSTPGCCSTQSTAGVLFPRNLI